VTVSVLRHDYYILYMWVNFVFQAAEEHDCALFVHPWDMEQSGRMKKYWLPWLVGMYSALYLSVFCSIGV